MPRESIRCYIRNGKSERAEHFFAPTRHPSGGPNVPWVKREKRDPHDQNHAHTTMADPPLGLAAAPAAGAPVLGPIPAAAEVKAYKAMVLESRQTRMLSPSTASAYEMRIAADLLRGRPLVCGGFAPLGTASQGKQATILGQESYLSDIAHIWNDSLDGALTVMNSNGQPTHPWLAGVATTEDERDALVFGQPGPANIIISLGAHRGPCKARPLEHGSRIDLFGSDVHVRFDFTRAGRRQMLELLEAKEPYAVPLPAFWNWMRSGAAVPHGFGGLGFTGLVPILQPTETCDDSHYLVVGTGTSCVGVSCITKGIHHHFHKDNGPRMSEGDCAIIQSVRTMLTHDLTGNGATVYTDLSTLDKQTLDSLQIEMYLDVIYAMDHGQEVHCRYNSKDKATSPNMDFLVRAAPMTKDALDRHRKCFPSSNTARASTALLHMYEMGKGAPILPTLQTLGFHITFRQGKQLVTASTEDGRLRLQTERVEEENQWLSVTGDFAGIDRDKNDVEATLKDIRNPVNPEAALFSLVHTPWFETLGGGRRYVRPAAEAFRTQPKLGIAWVRVPTEAVTGLLSSDSNYQSVQRVKFHGLTSSTPLTYHLSLQPAGIAGSVINNADPRTKANVKGSKPTPKRPAPDTTPTVQAAAAPRPKVDMSIALSRQLLGARTASGGGGRGGAAPGTRGGRGAGAAGRGFGRGGGRGASPAPTYRDVVSRAAPYNAVQLRAAAAAAPAPQQPGFGVDVTAAPRPAGDVPAAAPANAALAFAAPAAADDAAAIQARADKAAQDLILAAQQKIAALNELASQARQVAAKATYNADAVMEDIGLADSFNKRATRKRTKFIGPDFTVEGTAPAVPINPVIPANLWIAEVLLKDLPLPGKLLELVRPYIEIGQSPPINAPADDVWLSVCPADCRCLSALRNTKGEKLNINPTGWDSLAEQAEAAAIAAGTTNDWISFDEVRITACVMIQGILVGMAGNGSMQMLKEFNRFTQCGVTREAHEKVTQCIFRLLNLQMFDVLLFDENLWRAALNGIIPISWMAVMYGMHPDLPHREYFPGMAYFQMNNIAKLVPESTLAALTPWARFETVISTMRLDMIALGQHDPSKTPARPFDGVLHTKPLFTQRNRGYEAVQRIHENITLMTTVWILSHKPALPEKLHIDSARTLDVAASTRGIDFFWAREIAHIGRKNEDFELAPLHPPFLYYGINPKGRPLWPAGETTIDGPRWNPADYTAPDPNKL